MIDNKIMYEIVEKLHENVSALISICDVSGRVIVSTDSSHIGQMSLLAIEALDINSKVTAPLNSRGQSSGAAIPLYLEKSRIGALVLQGSGNAGIQVIEILEKTIELLYRELLLSKKEQSRSLEREQFLYEWLHLQADYTDNFIKRGEHLDIDITQRHTIILMELDEDDVFVSSSIIKNLLDKCDILLPLSQNQNLFILRENEDFEKRYRRVISAGRNYHTGICSGSFHLHTAYQAALDSLRFGKILFPDEYLHHYESMKLAIALSKIDIPGLEGAFSLLIKKGRNAQLAETAMAYIRYNGDIQKICEVLHIHRNSIPYRIRRIQEICGCDLTKSYGLLCLYASLIRYLASVLP